MKRNVSCLGCSLLFSLIFIFVAGLVGTVVSNEAMAQTRPAIVKNVDEPGRTPWETRSQFLPNAGGCYAPTDCYDYTDGATYAVFNLRPIPAGKRWIVQMASGGMANGNGRVTNIELSNIRTGLLFDGLKWAYGGPFAQGNSFSSAIFSANLFATFGPGETPTVRVSSTPSLVGYSVIVFSGYLIDAN